MTKSARRMSVTFFVALLVPMAVATLSARKAEANPREEKGEIHVYVTDAQGKVPDLSKASVLVYLEPEGGKRETLKPTLVTPAKPEGKEHEGAEHGGGIPEDAVVKETGSWRIGIEFHASHGGEEGDKHGKAKSEGHEKGKGEEDEEQDQPSIAHFAAPVELEAYACPMKDSPPSDKPGKCPKCGMALKEMEKEFDVAVVLKMGAETVNAKGFHYPPMRMPESFSAGVKSIDDAVSEMDKLASGGQLKDVHKVADRIRQIARALPKTKDVPKNPSVDALSKELSSLFTEIDKAADAGKASETKAVLEKYKKAVQNLKTMKS